MASGTSSNPPSAAATAPPPTYAPPTYAEFIDDQLEKTNSYVRFVDIGVTVLTLAVAAIVFLFTMSLVDHWIAPGGLGVVGRTITFLLLVGGIGFYAIRKLTPYLVNRINPAFAALKIEQAEPSLKNSLLNFLLLRGQHEGISPVVIDGLEQQAATGLSRVSVEAAVDRTKLIRLSIALVAVLLMCALYTVFSPKDLFPSVGRMVVPWANIDAVTRVRIENVRPGNAEIVLLAHADVSAEVKGLRDDEGVFLVYSSSDERAIDQRIRMYRAEGERHYSCVLPEGEQGLAGDVVYRVEAGDCVSPNYQLTLVSAPSFQIRSIEYHYPPYTELSSRTLEGVGDIKAIDGTRAVIRAEANQDIASAAMDLKGLRDKTLPMSIEARFARRELALRRRVTGDDSIPELTSYQLRLTTPTGARNENPIRHRIRITRDLPPIVEIVRPTSVSVEVPQDGEIYFQVRARDPDFRIASVSLFGRQEANQIFDQDLIKHLRTDGEPLRDAYRTTFRFVPQRYKLQPGDVVHVMASATDNKQPNPNRSETAEYQIRITEPERRDPAADPDDPPPLPKDDPPAETEQGGGKSDSQPGQDGQGGGASESQDEPSAEDDGQGGTGGTKQKDAERSEKPGSQHGGEQSDGQDSQQRPGGDTEQGGQDNRGAPNDGDAVEGREGGQDGTESSGESADGAPEGADAESDELSDKTDNDGDAFKELNEYLQQKRGQQENESPSDTSKQPKQGDNKQGDNKQGGDKQGGDKQGTGSEDQPNATDSGSGQSGEEGGRRQADNKRTAAEEDGEPPQDGDDPQAGPSEQPPDAEPGSDEESAAGSKKSHDEGGGGVGNEGQQAPPPPEGQDNAREKSGDAKPGSQNDKEPGDSGVSKHDSDSAEGREGSQKGKGEEGGGQHANESGEGAGGSKTPADDGANASEEPGHGDDSNRAGDDKSTDQKTGSKGDQPGTASDGDGSDPGNGGNRDGDESNVDDQPPPADSGDSSSQDGQRGTGQNGRETGAHDRPGEASGDGRQGRAKDLPAPEDQLDDSAEEPGADDPNLDYARKTTELVLDYLRDEMDKGGLDSELKRKLGWTDEEFAEFVRRHRKLRERAEQPGEDGRAAKKELDESLRSLGLQRPSENVRTGKIKTEKATGLRQTNRTRPPRDDQERFDAFRKDALSSQ